MNKIFLFLLIATVSAVAATPSLVKKIQVTEEGGSMLGVVSPTYRCGGVGTPLQLRISDCEGRCRLVPGTLYNCEYDFLPSESK